MIALLPPDIHAGEAAIIILASFLTSGLTAALGLGGGLALLGVMSIVLPPIAIIPVHGAAQLAANLSRLYLQRIFVAWPLLVWFGAGAIIGAGMGAASVITLPGTILRGVIGVFILIMLWAPTRPGRAELSARPASRARSAGRPVSGRLSAGMLMTGILSTMLTMFVGATGPFVAATLANRSLSIDERLATHAAAMSLQHGLKCAAFALAGFSFAPWAGLIVMIAIAGFGGAFVGTRIMQMSASDQLDRWFRALLTLIALYLVGRTGISLIRTG